MRLVNEARKTMSEKLQRLTKTDMTEAQRACFDLLCDVFHGEHGTGAVSAGSRHSRTHGRWPR